MSRTYSSRIQLKYDISTNWEKATSFQPLAGELIIYSDLNKIKIGDGLTLVNDLPFFISGGGESFGEIIESTPETLSKDIANAGPYSIIALAPGNYDRIRLIGKDSFAENLTIVGQEGVKVAGVEISSGIMSADVHGNWNGDVSQSILSSGLTLKCVDFTDAFSLRNARVDDLTIDSCNFEGCNIFISPECFGDSYGADLGEGSIKPIYRFPYAHLNQKNTVVNNCTLNEVRGVEYQNGMASGIHIIGIENITVTNNTISGPSTLYTEGENYIYHGIKIGGEFTDYKVCSHGEVKVINNTVNNTKSRAISVYNVYDGDITIASNTILNGANQDGTTEYIIVRYSENVTVEERINGKYAYANPNTFDGNEISTTRGGFMISSTVLDRAQYYQSLVKSDSKMDVHPLTYDSREDENEEALEAWLEHIVTEEMEPDTIRNIAIRCGQIIPYIAMGTIHKQSSGFVTLEVISHVNGKIYTKLKVNTWRDTVCETEVLNNKIDSKANLIDLDAKMDEAVLIYNGKNDTDETNLNTWLNSIMSEMADNSIRNISVRVGGAAGDGKGIIPWPALGVIHKHTSAYAIINVTTQINGNHYSKICNNGTWKATTCIEDKINLKADKTAMEAALANKADKADIENLSGNEVAIFDPAAEGTADNPPSVMEWLDNKIIPSMTDKSIKYIYIPDGYSFFDPNEFRTVYQLIGTVQKFNDNNVIVNVFEPDGTNIIKTKLNGAWKTAQNSKVVLNEKVSAVADVYESVDDTDETKLNSWLETISDYNRDIFGNLLGMQDGSTKFISVNTPAVADGALLRGTLYKHSCDSAAIDFVSQEDGKRHIKIKTNGAWQDTLAISNSGQQDPGSNAEMITNSQSMTEKEVAIWLDQDILPNMEDGSTRNISIRSSNLFDSYYGTIGDEVGVGTIYKRDNDYVVLDLVSVFSGRHITKVKSPDYPAYDASDFRQGVWKPHMSITPYNYVNTKSECYTGEWDESKINDWLQDIGQDMTTNSAPPSMNYPTYVRNIEILHGPDNNRLIGTLYTYGLLDSDKIAHLTDYNTGKQYIKRRYMGVWEAMKEFNGSGSSDGVTEAQLEERLQEAMSSFDQVDNTSDLDKPISTATQAALDTKAPAGYGLGTNATYLNDFNAVKPSGFYYTGETTENRPQNVNAYSNVVYIQRTSSEFTQFITSISNNSVVVRNTTNGGASWQTYRMVTSDMFSYSNGTLNITM